jgi:serine/threonine protein kinase
VGNWPGNERYQVLRRLGEGGMGVVYEALDRERDQRIAIKTLLRFSPDALYRFKQEFRTLADVIHPNLVRLYDLVASDDADVFFSMELVRGTTFIEHVLAASHPTDPASTAATARPARARPGGAASSEPRATDAALPAASLAPSRQSPADLARLRPALRQLAEGIHALHAAGKLHRDIKPSNVLVTPEGRVVLLDFGVATEIGQRADVDHAFVGTARYMAPEQATDDAPTPASDWYSFGVMLYEALVGAVPFVGSAGDVLTRKNLLDPPAPHELAEGVAPDLDGLATELLRRDPSERPTGPQVLARLGRRSAGATPLPPALPTGVPTLVGRDVALRALADAFDSTREGASVTLLVSGASGMGKSALVRHFLDALVDRGAATVLRGRVYQRETVPYKVFDSVIDALSRHLPHLVGDERSGTLSGDVRALARLFPVLSSAADSTAPEPAGVDPHAVRRRAFSALHALLAELCRRGPLVICIEDVHWGDRDSVGLLLEALRAPIALVLTYEDGAAGVSPFLDEMRARWPSGAERRHVTVGPLGADEARELALSLLGSGGQQASSEASVIARESGGSPFLVEELVRSALGNERQRPVAESGPAGAGAIDTMVRDRLARLGPGARRLLELVAVGGRPLETALVGAAAGLTDGAEEAVSELRARRFVRTQPRGGREWIEISHGRIAEAIIAPMPPDAVREHHGRLALELEKAPGVDAEALALHLLGAGHDLRAAEWAEHAADEASAKLAFDQAVRLYKLALRTRESIDPTSAALQRLRLRLGEADGHLSSAQLEGPLKEQVDDLVRLVREVEEIELAIARLNAEAGSSLDAAPELRAEAARLEGKLALARARVQDAVVDLALDAPASQR